MVKEKKRILILCYFTVQKCTPLFNQLFYNKHQSCLKLKKIYHFAKQCSSETFLLSLFMCRTFQYFATLPSPALGCYLPFGKWPPNMSDCTLHCVEHFWQRYVGKCCIGWEKYIFCEQTADGLLNRNIHSHQPYMQL